jgi:hypothetical protein
MTVEIPTPNVLELGYGMDKVDENISREPGSL